METKTKLGISVSIAAALTYFMGLFGGYLVLLVLAGYILWKEENLWLKQTVVKAVTICVTFSVVIALIGLVPDAINLLDDVFSVFGKGFSFSILSRMITLINSVLKLAEKLLLLALGFFALKGKSLRIDALDNFVNKHFSQNEPQ